MAVATFNLNPESANNLVKKVDKHFLKLKITSLIGEIDLLLNSQLNKILHNHLFQKLESSWRGLYYLTMQTASYKNVKIKFLYISLSELERDIVSPLEFDQSQLFKYIYNNEFDSPGGEPFGLLIGDYYCCQDRSKRNRLGVEALKGIAKVAAAAFVPFITGAGSELFGVDSFVDLQFSSNITSTFNQSDFLPWRLLRGEEDSRFLGVALPRVLARQPYDIDNPYIKGFCFYEEIKNYKDYLWSNAVYYFSANVARAFSYYGWFTDLKGVEKNKINKGLVSGLLQRNSFNKYLAMNNTSILETNFTSIQERELSKLGFITLCPCKFSQYAAIYSASSIQQSARYNKMIATTNAYLSSKIDYILCVSRFAHYIKVMVREKIGSFNSTKECEKYIQDWLLNFTAVIDEMSDESKTKYPLREAKISISELRGKPRSYSCVIHLRPHFHADTIETALQLVTEINI